MTLTDARVIAARLSLPPEVVRALQRRGFLRRLDLGEREIRERLWRAHLAHLSAARLRIPCSRGGGAQD
ncbi:MAG: hypothetical protein ACR2GT_05180 [Gaiellaceae bacterium]